MLVVQTIRRLGGDVSQTASAGTTLRLGIARPGCPTIRIDPAGSPGHSDHLPNIRGTYMAGIAGNTVVGVNQKLTTAIDIRRRLTWFSRIASATIWSQR
ncbi:hypothetical protein TPR58_11525 [Sphingomonas sp. HF-S3]|uniref:Uncharacterized protein n=1 Tax=Sphingomonas rustica TaxID=3103142 RepID=A0ABV0B8A0_9SPHN